jgi:hypothetical protein
MEKEEETGFKKSPGEEHILHSPFACAMVAPLRISPLVSQ